MTNIEDLRHVITLALEVEDRSPEERAALLRQAHKVDAAYNRQTVTNPHEDAAFWQPSRLARLAGCTKQDCKVCNEEPDRTWKDDPIPVNRHTLRREFVDGK